MKITRYKTYIFLCVMQLLSVWCMAMDYEPQGIASLRSEDDELIPREETKSFPVVPWDIKKSHASTEKKDIEAPEPIHCHPVLGSIDKLGDSGCFVCFEFGKSFRVEDKKK